jgi:hypothetical protein
MVWQDAVLSIGGLIFILALLPSIFGPDKPAFLTSLLNTIVVSSFMIVYLSFSLWLSAVTTGLTASMWLILAFQKYQRKDRSS